MQSFGTSLLQPEIGLENELVSSGLRLRHRLLGRDEVDEKALLGLTGVLRTTRKTFAGRPFVNLEGFAPSTEWEFISKDAREDVVAGGPNDLQLHAD
jgi:hypothetical protein